MINKAKITITALSSALILILASCSDTFLTTKGEIWGTYYHIVYKSPQNLDSLIVGELQRIDMELSMFNSNSHLSAVNSGATDTVSEAFAYVFDLSKTVSLHSGGVYDPTVAPLVELWGFGRTETNTEPTDSAIEAARALVGIAACQIDNNGILHRKTAGTTFDFSSVAKGYGIDCVGRLLEEHGVTDYMIEIGGEILASGQSPSGRPWRIQVDSPTGGAAHERLTIVELGPSRTALASSGNYRNYRVDSLGNAYGHTISPLTGRPAVGKVIAATVLATDCATADAVATACMASGSDDAAFAITDSSGCQVLLVLAEGGDSLCVRSRGSAF